MFGAVVLVGSVTSDAATTTAAATATRCPSPSIIHVGGRRRRTRSRHHHECTRKRRTAAPASQIAFVIRNDDNIIWSRSRRRSSSSYGDVPARRRRRQQPHQQHHDGRSSRRPASAQRRRGTLRLFSQSSSSNNNSPPHQYKTRRLDNVKIPLLDIMSTPALPNEPTLVVPLPSQHLPGPLRTCHTYGVQLQRPLYQMIIDAAVTGEGSTPMSPDEQLAFMATGADSMMMGRSGTDRNVFGQVLAKPNMDSYVGAVGCATQVLMNDFVKEGGAATGEDGAAAGDGQQIVLGDKDDGDDKTEKQRTKFVLCRGSFRFVVREIIQTIPFPIAIVDELLDDDLSSPSSISSGADDGLLDDVDGIGGFDDDVDVDDDDIYHDLAPSQLIGRTMSVTKTWLDQQLEKTSKPLTVLEKSILEQSGVDPSLERQSIEEMVATFDVFRIEMMDLFPTTVEQLYAVAFLVAEFINMENAARIELVTMTDASARLKRVLRHVETRVSETTARKLTEQVSSSTSSLIKPATSPPVSPAGDGSDEGSTGIMSQDANNDDDADDATGTDDTSGQQLTVGEPQLPPWTRQIGIGTQLEYFWNEEYEWCLCEVLEKQQITDYELLVTVKFELDGTTHTLPINGDDKIRWRPPMQSPPPPP